MTEKHYASHCKNSYNPKLLLDNTVFNLKEDRPEKYNHILQKLTKTAEAQEADAP